MYVFTYLASKADRDSETMNRWSKKLPINFLSINYLNIRSSASERFPIKLNVSFLFCSSPACPEILKIDLFPMLRVRCVACCISCVVNEIWIAVARLNMQGWKFDFNRISNHLQDRFKSDLSSSVSMGFLPTRTDISTGLIPIWMYPKFDLACQLEHSLALILQK